MVVRNFESQHRWTLKEKPHRSMRAFVGLLQVLYLILLRILSLVYRKKRPSIPSITDPLLTLSATTLAKKIREGEITCYDVVSAYVKRIKEVNPQLNAVVEDRFVAAISEARIHDEQLKAGKVDVKTLEKEKPLYGVPLTVKESCGVKGLSNTGCTLAQKELKAIADDPVIESFRKAGAIPLCVTNTPEMCCNFDTTNLLYGRTYNPYDSRYTPGGSSGGEGALLGAGASLIGIGSDLSGSIRLPALFNGVFGFKPTFGIISNEGHMPTSDDEIFNECLTLGPMARYAEDLSLAARIMLSTRDRDLRLDVPVDLDRLKIYYRKNMDETIGILPIAEDMEQCVVRATNHFAQRGVRAEQLSISWPSTIVEIVMATFLSMKRPPNILVDANEPKVQKNAVIEVCKFFTGQSQHTFAPVVFNLPLQTHILFPDWRISYYMQQKKILRQKFLEVLGENEVFICPTYRMPATFPLLVLLDFTSAACMGIFNVLGFPAVHVPMGLNSDGLPIGVQVVAAPYQDRLCLAVAEELGRAFGGWTPPPSISTNG